MVAFSPPVLETTSKFRVQEATFGASTATWISLWLHEMYSDDLVVRAWVEAALGERERAMELLRENGSKPGSQGIHAGVYWLRSLRDYPPFQEFFGVTE